MPMGRGTKTTEFLKECMADALFQLMKTKALEKITVQEIAELAGVGRATWFRNFAGKNEALTFKLEQLWERWTQKQGIHSDRRYSISIAPDFFHFNEEVKEYYLLIYKAGQQSVIYDAFYHIIFSRYGTDAEDCYKSRFYSYGLFGLLDEWIKRGCCETAEELSVICGKVLAGELPPFCGENERTENII